MDMQTLKEVRAERLLSIRELADRAGVAFSTIHLIETGQREPSFRVMREVSAALGVGPTEIAEFAAVIQAAKEGKAVAA
jgi:transcriptional regulator with XRE-family HTH domain